MFRIALKDFRLFLKDRRALLMTFFMPVALITIFALAFGGERERNAQPVSLLVTDLDQTADSRDIITQLDSLQSLSVTRIPLDSAERLVKTGDESAVLVFHKGFADSIRAAKPIPVEMEYDKAKGPEVAILQQAIMSNLMRMVMTKEMSGMNPQMAAVPDSVKTAAAVVPGGTKKDNELPIKMTALIEEKQNGLGLIQAVAGTAVMMLLFGLAAVGAGLLDEKESGTLKRLLYSPIKPHDILFGKMIASIGIALIQLTVLFGYAKYSFNLDLGKNVPALLLMMFSTAFAASGFGMFLASIARSRQQVQSLSTVIVLSMSAIGGSMVPSFMMPAFMQKLSVISVNYWSIQGFYDIYWRNLAFSDPAFLLRPLMLILIGTVMISLGLVFFRRNILKLS